jgi:hypothetical protein
MDKHGHAKELLRHLRLLDVPVRLPTAEDDELLVPRRGRGTLLLDFYSPEDVAEALDRYGVTARLAARGFSRPVVELETSDPLRQIVRVRAARDGREGCVGEAFLRAGSFETDAPFAQALHGRNLTLLFIQWLRLQDPTRPFTAERPALPGQDHPGLGIGREVMGMFLGMADRLHFGGIVSCPEFAHNAVLYAAEFRFLDPAAQGRFEALREACAGVPLAELAWGVDRGCLLDETTGKCIVWSREEMVRAAEPALQQHFAAPAYLERVEAARRTCRWRFDRSRLPVLTPNGPQA